MSAKPENKFQAGVHSYFDPLLVYHEKMANPYRGGTADVWYSGKGRGSKDLWIEWKFLAVPARDTTVIDLVGGKNPAISQLQQHWLKERYLEGRNVWVGVGSTKGGIILMDREWERPLTAGDFRRELMSRKELAAFIVSFVQGRTA